MTDTNISRTTIILKSEQCKENERGQALYKALCNGNKEMVRCFITTDVSKRGIDEAGWFGRSHPFYYGLNPLLVAAQHGHIQICEMLLTMGADVNTTGDIYLSSRWTPLHYAADHNHTKICCFLIKSGANVNAVSNNKITPLYMAVQNGNARLYKRLFDAGANIYVDNNIMAHPHSGVTILHWAAKLRDPSIFQMILDSGAVVNVNELDKSKQTPLHHAAEGGKVETCNFLLRAGAKVNAVDAYGNLPLHSAAASSDVDTCALLLDAGTDMNVQSTIYGCTALHIAGARGALGICTFLLDVGADIDIKTRNNGQTALHCAARMGYLETCKLLLHAGADFNIRDNDDQIAQYVACPSIFIEFSKLTMPRRHA